VELTAETPTTRSYVPVAFATVVSTEPELRVVVELPDPRLKFTPDELNCNALAVAPLPTCNSPVALELAAIAENLV
jgi:hypothetical protein